MLEQLQCRSNMEKRHIKILDRFDLVRDQKSKAVINIDNDMLQSYKNQRDFNLKMIKNLKDTETIKEDINEIKQLIQQLLKK